MEQGGSEARQMGCQRQHLNPHQKSALVDTPLLNWGKREIGRRLHTAQLRTHLSLPWVSRPDGLNFKSRLGFWWFFMVFHDSIVQRIIIVWLFSWFNRELLSEVRFSAPRSSIKGFITTLILVLNHRLEFPIYITNFDICLCVPLSTTFVWCLSWVWSSGADESSVFGNQPIGSLILRWLLS